MTDETRADIDAVLAERQANGGNYWTGADGRFGVGEPFSTLTSLAILHELGVSRDHEAVQGALEVMLRAWREDGRFRIAPRASMYPCHTAITARVLCRFGYAGDERLQRTFAHLLEIQHDDGGWRCNRFPFGRGPETDYSNPGVTLHALDAFRFSEHLNQDPALDPAVESLLNHWVLREPMGPCRFGIGTLFMQVEYPFLRYNLFYYLYVLSFYEWARNDPRYAEALQVLQSKLHDQGSVVVERPHRKLASLSLCAKGEPSQPATGRYHEILKNLEE